MRAIAPALVFVAVVTFAVACSSDERAAPAVVEGQGDITSAVEEYRALLGPDNGGEPVSASTGRREINWDGVDDAEAAPNDYDPELFNSDTAPRARGIVLSSSGPIQISADADNPTGTAPRFAHLEAGYADQFVTFSEERLFSPVESNVVEARFFVPGTSTPAVVRGFGAVYTDVDTEHTAFEYFDVEGNSLGSYAVPLSDRGLSFLGVAFDEPIVAMVRIAYGTDALGSPDGPDNDVAVMDDFIFGEPQAIS